jgi:hypothetical protein
MCAKGNQVCGRVSINGGTYPARGIATEANNFQGLTDFLGNFGFAKHLALLCHTPRHIRQGVTL